MNADCAVSGDTYSAKLELSPADGYRYLVKLKHKDGTEERITLEGHGFANLTKVSAVGVQLVEWEESIFNDTHNESTFWIGWQAAYLQTPKLTPEDAQCEWSNLKIKHYYNDAPLEEHSLDKDVENADLNGHMVHFKVITHNYKLPGLLDGDRHELRMEGTLTVNGVATDFSLPMAEWVIENQTMVRQEV